MSVGPLLEKPNYDHLLVRYTSVILCEYGGFHKWGYPHLRKPSYEFRSWDMKHDDVS